MGNAYGHNVPRGGGQNPIEIDEQFSDLNVRTDEVIIIIGSVRNVGDRPYELSAGIFVTSRGVDPLDSLLDSIYGNRADWYFRIEHDMPNPLILGPGETLSYEMKVYPLKEGAYHLHSYFKSEQGLSVMARGVTAAASGSDAVTAGEIREFYIPVAGGFALIVVLAVMAKRRYARTKTA